MLNKIYINKKTWTSHPDLVERQGKLQKSREKVRMKRKGKKKNDKIKNGHGGGRTLDRCVISTTL